MTTNTGKAKSRIRSRILCSVVNGVRSMMELRQIWKHFPRRQENVTEIFWNRLKQRTEVNMIIENFCGNLQFSMKNWR